MSAYKIHDPVELIQAKLEVSLNPAIALPVMDLPSSTVVRIGCMNLTIHATFDSYDPSLIDVTLFYQGARSLFN
jgi:hypothetical protein